MVPGHHRHLWLLSDVEMPQLASDVPQQMLQVSLKNKRQKMQNVSKLTPSCCNSLKKYSGIRSVCNMQIYRGFYGLSSGFFIIILFMVFFLYFLLNKYVRIYIVAGWQVLATNQSKCGCAAVAASLDSRCCCKMQHATPLGRVPPKGGQGG